MKVYIKYSNNVSSSLKSCQVKIKTRGQLSLSTIADTGSVGFCFAAFFQAVITRFTRLSTAEHEIPTAFAISDRGCPSKYRSITFLSAAAGRHAIKASKWTRQAPAMQSAVPIFSELPQRWSLSLPLSLWAKARQV